MNKREWMLQAAFAAIRGDQVAWGSMGDTTAYLGELYDAIVAATSEPADEGWIEHRGEKPYPEGMVEIRCRDGNLEVGDADGFFWDRDPEDPSVDIIAWRPARA